MAKHREEDESEDEEPPRAQDREEESGEPKEAPPVNKNKKYRREKPWDHDGIDHWKVRLRERVLCSARSGWRFRKLCRDATSCHVSFGSLGGKQEKNYMASVS